MRLDLILLLLLCSVAVAGDSPTEPGTYSLTVEITTDTTWEIRGYPAMLHSGEVYCLGKDSSGVWQIYEGIITTDTVYSWSTDIWDVHKDSSHTWWDRVLEKSDSIRINRGS